MEKTIAQQLKEALRKGHVKFSYTKKDGTIREAYGTTEQHEVDYFGATPTGSGAEKTGVIAYFDLEKEGWRSCKEDSIISFELAND